MPVAPSCPRCGYDLSGVASSWQGTCPLEGVCSECGLTVRWAELLNPRLTIPEWSFEHAVYRSAAKRLGATWSRALRPGRFWAAVRLEHPVIVIRLIVYWVVCLLAAHAAVFIGTVSLRRLSPWRSFRPEPVFDLAARSLWPYRVGDPIRLLAGNLLRLDYDFIVGFPHWFLLAWFILTPLSFLLLTDTFRLVRVRYIHLVRAAVYSFAPLPPLVLLYALAVCVVLRVGIGPWYGFALDLMGLVRLTPTLTLAAAAGWLIRFWWVVPRDYLRLPHARAVSLAMLTVSALGAALIVVLLAWAKIRA